MEYIPRDREDADSRLYNDYFSPQPLYNDVMFRRRFRMHKHIFQRILTKLSESDVYFQQRPDATGRLSASALQTCTAVMRMLAYGSAANAVNEYLKIAASTARECLRHFVEGVISNFGQENLRRATPTNVERLLRESNVRGFPGMLGSIDCMYWEWKNCPRAWKGMYQGRSKTTTIILEVVVSQDLWIWHTFFGTPGSLNDINVLQRSPMFDDICEGRAPHVNSNVNAIPITWDTILHMIYIQNGKHLSQQSSFHKPLNKDYLHKSKKVIAKIDVKRAFGVLQARFAIIRQPALAWSTEILWKSYYGMYYHA